MSFGDRTEAGRRLAEAVVALGLDRPVVLGMARGGVPVAAEVARRLGAPLDVLVVRKLGYPPQPELAMGAIGEGGVRVINDSVVEQLRVPQSVIEEVAAVEQAELERRLVAYRDGRPAVEVAGRTVVVVDDGLATGATARAAISVLRGQGATRVVLASPVGPPNVVRVMQAVADDVVCLEVSDRFFGIGQWYADFRQVSDDEVRRLLVDAAGGAAFEVGTHPVDVPVDGMRLPGDLVVPANCRGLVVFAHGSGSSRASPRNRFVADVLHHVGVATLLFDLLTDEEAVDRSNVFDITLLGGRLSAAVDWARSQPDLASLPVGLFGASTGAAAAVVAAARAGSGVGAVVSRGGRPDLAPPSDLRQLHVPTLLLVGSADPVVLDLNRRALALLPHAELEVVDGAGHLFEEPGTLDRVARRAAGWFVAHLARD